MVIDNMFVFPGGAGLGDFISPFYQGSINGILRGVFNPVIQQDKNAMAPPIEQPDIKPLFFVKIPDKVKHLIWAMLQFIALADFFSFGPAMQGLEFFLGQGIGQIRKQPDK